MYILVSQGIVIYTTDKLADALEKKINGIKII